jgi:hypothetical protein
VARARGPDGYTTKSTKDTKNLMQASTHMLVGVPPVCARLQYSVIPFLRALRGLRGSAIPDDS